MHHILCIIKDRLQNFTSADRGEGRLGNAVENYVLMLFLQNNPV